MAADTHPTEETFRDILQKVKLNDSSTVNINLNNLAGSKNEWVNNQFSISFIICITYLV
jgi:hypothetical protein